MDTSIERRLSTLTRTGGIPQAWRVLFYSAKGRLARTVERNILARRSTSGAATARGIAGTLMCAVTLSVACSAEATEGTANGTVTYRAKSGVVSAKPIHAFLVKGPDAVDASRVIRRLVFSSSHLGAKIGACSSMSCTDAALGDGMSLDLDSGPRLNYWVVFDDQKIQYSGTAPRAALRLTSDTALRVSGKLSIDDFSAGGARVDIEFDAPLIKEFR